jgi:hypothetical protein
MTPNNSPENQPREVIVHEEPATVVTVPVAVTKEKRKPRILIRSRKGMFDVPEIAAVGFGGFLLLMLLLSYFFWLRPAQADLRQRAATRESLENDYSKLKTTLGENQSTEGKVADIVGSLERFETNYLSVPAQGNSSLFARVNEIISKNNLRNTAGPDFAPLQTISLDKYDPAKEQSRNQNLYPGTAVTVTVEGGYANLRRFISDLENSRQFVVIRAIEIEAENNSPTAGGGSGGGGAQSSADLETVRRAAPTSGIPSQIVPMPQQSRPNSINPRAPQQQQQIQPQQQSRPIQQPAPPRMAASGGRGSVVSLKVELVSYFRRNPADAMNGGIVGN